MRKYRVNIYYYFNGTSIEKEFNSNGIIFKNNIPIIGLTPIINNIFEMKTEQTFKIKANKNEMDITRYELFANKGIFVITKDYL
jgi:hypothetical protein